MPTISGHRPFAWPKTHLEEARSSESSRLVTGCSAEMRGRDRDCMSGCGNERRSGASPADPSGFKRRRVSSREAIRRCGSVGGRAMISAMAAGGKGRHFLVVTILI